MDVLLLTVFASFFMIVQCSKVMLTKGLYVTHAHISSFFLEELSHARSVCPVMMMRATAF